MAPVNSVDAATTSLLKAKEHRARKLVKRYSTILRGERQEISKDVANVDGDINVEIVAPPRVSSATQAAFVRFLASSAASIVAEGLTLPTDVAKVRLQVQQRSGGAPKYRGMYHCVTSIAKEEGIAACWKGLAPALTRQICYTSLALVMYEPLRNVICSAMSADPDAAPTFAQRLLAGGSSGAISIGVFNWAEVLKTQMQTSTDGTTMRQVALRVYKTEGIIGFWAGVWPNVARTFLVNAAELGTYDQAKTMLVPIVGDNPLAHIGASGIAGVASACTSTPADVIKTRMMNYAGGQSPYKGMLDAGSQIIATEGISALYKGFVPIVTRKVAWCSSFFVTYEYLKGFFSGAS